LEELRNHFFKLNQELDNLARRPVATTGANLSYADGHLAFDYAVRGELVKEMQTIFTRLEVRNEELTRQLFRFSSKSWLCLSQRSVKRSNRIVIAHGVLNSHLETFSHC
jgi:prepilin-type processing-associated H-X9-DG protein